jgi:hypothetical protein
MSYQHFLSGTPLADPGYRGFGFTHPAADAAVRPHFESNSRAAAAVKTNFVPRLFGDCHESVTTRIDALVKYAVRCDDSLLWKTRTVINGAVGVSDNSGFLSVSIGLDMRRA